MRRKGQAGFTLIEMLVVLAIIATLLAITVPRYYHAIDNSKETVLVENLRISRDAIDKFYGDTGRYPESLDELVERKYLRKLPFDPETGTDSDWIIVAPDEQFQGQVYDLHSGAAGNARDGRAFGDL